MYGGLKANEKADRIFYFEQKSFSGKIYNEPQAADKNFVDAVVVNIIEYISFNIKLFFPAPQTPDVFSAARISDLLQEKVFSLLCFYNHAARTRRSIQLCRK